MPMNITHWAYRLQAMALLVFNQREAAERVFDSMLQRWPNDAYATASRVHVRMQRGHQAGAMSDAQALVQHHPKRSAADWFNLAFMQEQASQLEASEANFRQALAMDPKLDRAWYGLGLTLIRMKRFDEAVAALKRNTELQPMSPYGWYQLARVQIDRQKPEEARKIITHLKKFEPKIAEQLERETGLTAHG
jgi:tetratricopeptide (TPR) repeat protein